jgi:hypothetical protein
MAWRCADGSFMPESDKMEAYRVEYERYAVGGSTRARTTRRAIKGTLFCRMSSERNENGPNFPRPLVNSLRGSGELL